MPPGAKLIHGGYIGHARTRLPRGQRDTRRSARAAWCHPPPRDGQTHSLWPRQRHAGYERETTGGWPMRRHGNVRLLLACQRWLCSPPRSLTRHRPSRVANSADDRKRTAVEMCARELKSREKGKSVRVGSHHPLRLPQGHGQLGWLHDRPAQQARPQRAVVLRGELRRQEPVHGIRDLGRRFVRQRGRQRPSQPRLLERGRTQRYDVTGVRVTSDAGSSGRLVVLRVDGRKELLCLYRGRPALYRSV